MDNKQQIIDYITNSYTKRNYEYFCAKNLHLAMRYWTLATFNILGHSDSNIISEMTSFLHSCKNYDGGYGSAEGYTSTLFNTMIACQIAAMLNINIYDEKTVSYILGCGHDGVFYAETYNGTFIEEDNRFICAALISLALLIQIRNNCGRTDMTNNGNDVNDNGNRTNMNSGNDVNDNGNHTSMNNGNHMSMNSDNDVLSMLYNKGIDVERMVQYILRCYNTDGGFGCIPGAESHCGQVYACLASLKLLKALHRVDKQQIIFFLMNRQTASGGLNGRPYKKEDVCYSFWTFCSLDILNGARYVSLDMLQAYIRSCYSPLGGYADRPGNAPDGFHTMYALFGLQLMQKECLQRDNLHLGIFINYK